MFPFYKITGDSTPMQLGTTPRETKLTFLLAAEQSVWADATSLLESNTNVLYHVAQTSSTMYSVTNKQADRQTPWQSKRLPCAMMSFSVKH